MPRLMSDNRFDDPFVDKDVVDGVEVINRVLSGDVLTRHLMLFVLVTLVVCRVTPGRSPARFRTPTGRRRRNME